jgi:sulfite exporter TauE/SafE
VGVALLARAGGTGAGSAMRVPAWISRAIAAIHRRAVRLAPPQRAAAIGIASVLLPCGWLWAFAAVAAGTGVWWQGAVVMIAFWIGTVPVLAALGAGIASLGGAQRRWITALAGAAMIAVGVHTAFVRAPLAERALAAAADASEEIPSGTPACCRQHAASAGDGGEPQ